MQDKKQSSAQTNNCPLRVTVHVFDELRECIGQARVEVELAPGGTVDTLLRQMAEDYGERFIDIHTSSQAGRGICVVILNRRSLSLPEDLVCTLNAGDELHLIPPIAGG
jgi:MoaD family protein